MVLHNPNGRISRDVYTGEPDFNYYRKKQWSLGYAFEHSPTRPGRCARTCA